MLLIIKWGEKKKKQSSTKTTRKIKIPSSLQASGNNEEQPSNEVASVTPLVVSSTREFVPVVLWGIACLAEPSALMQRLVAVFC